ncbi:MAG: hypothetical protein AAFN41_09380, partial [Planctomycetota bacterium]
MGQPRGTARPDTSTGNTTWKHHPAQQDKNEELNMTPSLSRTAMLLAALAATNSLSQTTVSD